LSKQKSDKPLTIKFKLGQKIRVKQGIVDDDYPDMPIGGWIGIIEEIRDNGMYCVRWSD